ncbi:MAG TPA: dockerin type I domain-containing protein [Bacillota bacterium]|nr:dockerin type I domain-containing protein [Bacillota bacterium]HOK68035.1 dockerin type I domain-containing protein [Bacillota bacterium]HPP84581.1 dockerin type I domain-containing protein [Bacillota bacterium]
MPFRKKLVSIFTVLVVLLSFTAPSGVSATGTNVSGFASSKTYESGSGYFSSSSPYIDSYYSQLNADQKRLYDEVKTFTPSQNGCKFNLTNKITFTSSTQNPTEAETSQAMGEIFALVVPVFYAYIWDNPIAFVYDAFSYGFDTDQISGEKSGNHYVWTISGITFRLVVSKKYENNPNSYINAVLEKVNSFKSTHTNWYGILKDIHNYLCQTIVYDANATYAHEPYGALVAGRAVCEGYAEAFKLLCDKYKIPCALIIGEGVNGPISEPHMWNYVKMENGYWYAVDVTWDDQSAIFYDFFLVGHNTTAPNFGYRTFNQMHREDETILNYPILYSTAYVDPCKNGHTASDWIVTREATYTQSGERIKKCTVCGEIFQTEIIPKLEPPSGITLKPQSKLKVENGYLTGVQAEVTVAQLQNEFEGTLVVLDQDGQPLPAGSFVGTGCQIMIGGELVTIYIFGDVYGDGEIDAMDCLLVKRIVIGTTIPTAAQLKAACVSGDPEPSALDYLLIKKHFLGTYNLYRV